MKSGTRRIPAHRLVCLPLPFGHACMLSCVPFSQPAARSPQPAPGGVDDCIVAGSPGPRRSRRVSGAREGVWFPTYPQSPDIACTSRGRFASGGTIAHSIDGQEGYHTDGLVTLNRASRTGDDRGQLKMFGGERKNKK